MLPTKVEQSIKNLIHQERYSTYEIHRQNLSTNGANYLGELHEVNVKGKDKDGDKETNLFLKVINGADSLKWIPLAYLYRIELFVYRELSAIFAELQEDANVPSHERYKMVKSYEGSSTEAIILENIAIKGFKMHDRVQVVPLQLAEMVMKELAKLHGLSFALQEKRPDYFNTKIKKLQYPMIFGDDFMGYVRNMIDMTAEHFDDDVKNRVKRAYHKLADNYPQLFYDETTRRCICHGDCRSNNIMIKVHNDKVTDLYVLDYQLLHYGCPVLDILYFLYVNTDRQFRRAHLSHLKDLYHETLTTFLGYFNIDVDSVYSREMFEQDFKAKLDYGPVIGFVILPLTQVTEDEFPDLMGDISGIRFPVNDLYWERHRGIVEELIEWGYM